MNRILVAEREMRVLTLCVPNVELVDLFGELILLDGLSARNRKRETPFEVLHLVHRVEEQTLGEERDEERVRHKKRWRIDSGVPLLSHPLIPCHT